MSPAAKEVEVRKDRPEFREEITHALNDVAQKHGVSFADQIHAIVEANRKKGRLDYFVESKPAYTAGNYVWLVVTGYLQWHEWVYQIQEARAEDIWQPLQLKLEKWSYHYLLRKGFHPGLRTQCLAQEYAVEVALAVLQSPFPYDTEPDAWFQQIVIYTCCNQIEDWKRQEALAEKLAEALDREKPLKAGSDGVEYRLSSKEDRQVLHKAIAQLSNPKMREVLWLRYYGELSSEEIAEVIHSSYRYVDKLHCRAKQLLGKNLEDYGYIYE